MEGLGASVVKKTDEDTLAKFDLTRVCLVKDTRLKTIPSSSLAGSIFIFEILPECKPVPLKLTLFCKVF